MEVSSFKDVSQEFEATCNWLSSLGLNFEKGRINRYRKAMSRLASMDGTTRADISSGSKEEEHLQNTLFEIGEFSQLFRAFADNTPEGFGPLARSICLGQDAYSMEGPRANTEGRNFMFELLVAARLTIANLEISLEIADDVVWIAKNTNITLQCKRCKTLKAIRRNIEEADKQVQADIANPALGISSGVIAIDLTAALNPSFELYRERSVDLIQTRVKSEIRECLVNVIDVGYPISDHVKGVLVRHSALGHELTSGDPYYTQIYALWIRSPTPAMHELAKSLDRDGTIAKDLQEIYPE